MADLDDMSEFDADFGSLLEQTWDMFDLDRDEDESRKRTDFENIHLAIDHIKHAKRQYKERVEQERNEIRALQRTVEQQKLASTRSSALPSTQEHELLIEKYRTEHLSLWKQNRDLEQELNRLQGELESLETKLKEEDAREIDFSRMDASVLSLKLYHSLGFHVLPGEDTVLVASRNSKSAASVAVKDEPSEFDLVNKLWSLSEA